MENNIELKVDDIDYFETVNKLVMQYDRYQTISAVCNVVVMLRLLRYLQINANMAFLVKTMQNA